MEMSNCDRLWSIEVFIPLWLRGFSRSSGAEINNVADWTFTAGGCSKLHQSHLVLHLITNLSLFFHDTRRDSRNRKIRKIKAPRSVIHFQNESDAIHKEIIFEKHAWRTRVSKWGRCPMQKREGDVEEEEEEAASIAPFFSPTTWRPVGKTFVAEKNRFEVLR